MLSFLKEPRLKKIKMHYLLTRLWQRDGSYCKTFAAFVLFGSAGGFGGGRATVPACCRAPLALPAPRPPSSPGWSPRQLPKMAGTWPRPGTVFWLGELSQLGGQGREGKVSLFWQQQAGGWAGQDLTPASGVPAHQLARYPCQILVEQHHDKPRELFWGWIL